MLPTIAMPMDGWIKWYLAAGIAFNRLRFHRYFLLCGNLARRESTNFPIGLKRTVQIQNCSDDDSEGAQELFLFANDLWSMYGNNRVLEKNEGGAVVCKDSSNRIEKNDKIDLSIKQ